MLLDAWADGCESINTPWTLIIPFVLVALFHDIRDDWIFQHLKTGDELSSSPSPGAAIPSRPTFESIWRTWQEIVRGKTRSHRHTMETFQEHSGEGWHPGRASWTLVNETFLLYSHMGSLGRSLGIFTRGAGGKSSLATFAFSRYSPFGKVQEHFWTLASSYWWTRTHTLVMTATA